MAYLHVKVNKIAHISSTEEKISDLYISRLFMELSNLKKNEVWNKYILTV